MPLRRPNGNPRLLTDTRRTYRNIAESIIYASVNHLEATVGELENKIRQQYPDLTSQLTDVISDAHPDVMTAFHNACQPRTSSRLKPTPAGIPGRHPAAHSGMRCCPRIRELEAKPKPR